MSQWVMAQLCMPVHYMIAALSGWAQLCWMGAVVESGAMVAAGALVPPEKIVPSGQLWAGSPAKLMREMDEATQNKFLQTAHKYVEFGRAARLGLDGGL